MMLQFYFPKNGGKKGNMVLQLATDCIVENTTAVSSADSMALLVLGGARFGRIHSYEQEVFWLPKGFIYLLPTPILVPP